MGKVRDGRSLDAAQALAGGAQDDIVYISPEEDFDIGGYAPTPEESWSLFSSKSIVQVAAGEGHTIALASDGGVWACGLNDYGQCGNGSASYLSSLTQVVGLTKVKHIAAGGSHSLAVKSDGSVWAWGANGFGQLGDGSTVDRASPVQAIGLAGAKSCSAGACHSLAVTSSGGAYGWGDNYYGQAGSGSVNVCETAPAPVSGFVGATSIAAGGYHSLAVDTYGNVLAWGCNSDYQLGNQNGDSSGLPAPVAGLAGIASVAAGEHHSLALGTGGDVLAWGFGYHGQLGASIGYGINMEPTPVDGLYGIESIAAGRNHCLALDGNGDVLGWGDNTYGQLGDGSMLTTAYPVQASGLSGATLIAAGGDHSLAVAPPNSSLWAWGSNCYGQLGDLSSYLEAMPALVQAGLPPSAMDTRNVHGYVYPMATQELAPGFMDMHAVVVELRESFFIPAPPELSAKAVLLDSSGKGEFTIEDVPYGTYVLYIKQPGYLARPMLVTVSASDPDTVELAPPGIADGGVFNLWPGDCNNDNMVDNGDLDIVVDHFAVILGDQRYSAECDFDRDGVIGILDAMLSLSSSGLTSEDYPGAEGIRVNSRTVHGYVYPMATQEPAPGFREMHAVAVELRAAFDIPAPLELSAKAVLLDSSGNGEFTIEGVPYGDYVLYIKRPGCLARPMPVKVSATDPGTVELAPPGVADGGVFNLWPGDCNGDNVAGNHDMVEIADRLLADAQGYMYDPACDLDMDGFIEQADLLIAEAHLGRTSKDYAGAENVSIALPPEIANILLTFDLGEECLVPIGARNIATFAGKTITVTYDPEKLQPMGAAAQASGAYISVGAVPGTGVTVTSLSYGSVTLTFDAPVPQGKEWSGTVTVLKFITLEQGMAVVSVE